MRGKFVAFLLALFGVASIGIVQLTSEAQSPGQVGSAPRCSVNVQGARSQAFNIKNDTATVRFKVSGANNCRVQLSANSFYAPSMNGTPYSKQVLFDRSTKTYKSGNYALSVKLPERSTPKKGCYYQVDLTYGTNNIRPVLGYGHGRLDCSTKEEPKPSAVCKGLSKTKLQDNRYRFVARANVKNGAKVRSYNFETTRDGNRVDSDTVRTSNTTARYTFAATEPGTYTVRATVNTSVGSKSGAYCLQRFTVAQPEVPEQPAIEVEKFVEDVKYKRVGVNVEYDYQLIVTNTGDRELNDVVVTDTPEKGITLVSADLGDIEDNAWTYTIASLQAGESMDFSLTAKVPAYLAGLLTNTVCVDAPEIPGNPDDCDTADVDVPKPGEEVPTVVPAGTTPTELPETGPADAALQMIGAMSLAGSGAYYISSRRGL